MELVRIIDHRADLTNREFAFLEQLGCFCHSVVHQELLRGFAHTFLEDPSEITAVEAAYGGDRFYGDILLIVLFDKRQGLFDIEISQAFVGTVILMRGRPDQLVEEQESVTDDLKRACPCVRIVCPGGGTFPARSTIRSICC